MHMKIPYILANGIKGAIQPPQNALNRFLNLKKLEGFRAAKAAN